MFGEIFLIAWSGLALVWWVVAWRLVATADNPLAPDDKPVARLRSISVFKPLAPGGFDDGPDSVESFVAQLEPDMELLLGIHEADRKASGAIIADLREKYPKARIEVIYRSDPDDVPNPKIAWQKILAQHASGELWLWSDAESSLHPVLSALPGWNSRETAQQ